MKTNVVEAIHQSSLGMALRCPEQFRRRYVENEIIPPSIAMGRGTSVHAASKENLRQKIVTQQDLPLDVLTDAARDTYVKTFQAGVYLAKEDRPAKNRLINEGLEDALRCTRIYLEQVAPRVQPVAVEEPFRFDVDGLSLPVAGTLDYQEGGEVGDLKTTNRKWPDSRIKTVQPIFYSYAHERERGIRPRFTYHILIAGRGKTGPTSESLQELAITATDKDYIALFAKLKAFEAMLKAGVFIPANPGSWWCNEKWCGYHQTCPYQGNKLPTRWV